MRRRTYRRKINAVRIVHWALLLYLIIAALHGAVPSLWRLHIEKGDLDGPFRLLLFTSLLLAFPMLLHLLQKKVASLLEYRTCVYATPEYLLVWTLRGPPAFPGGAR